MKRIFLKCIYVGWQYNKIAHVCKYLKKVYCNNTSYVNRHNYNHEIFKNVRSRWNLVEHENNMDSKYLKNVIWNNLNMTRHCWRQWKFLNLITILDLFCNFYQCVIWFLKYIEHFPGNWMIWFSSTVKRN